MTSHGGIFIFRSNMKLLILVVVSAILISLNGTNAFADSPNQGIFPKDSKPYGTSYESWLEKWWQWNISFPEILPNLKHPRENYTADKCALKQTGPVWFLHEQFGPSEIRSCDVPRDKAIYAPIYDTLCYNNNEDPLTKTDTQMNKCLTTCGSGNVISASIDGRMIQNPEQYRFQTPFYMITVPYNNIFHAPPAGTFRGKADAIFLLFEPLAPGKHVLHLTSSIFQGPDSECNFSSDVTYNLNVR